MNGHYLKNFNLKKIISNYITSSAIGKFMKIKLISIGKTDDKEIINLCNKYQKRLPQNFNFQTIELKDLKNRKSLSEIEQKNKESELLLEQISPHDFVILLDENGKEFSSKQFSNYINQKFISNVNTLLFIIGGPYGFGDEIKNRAQEKISLSKMTFTHQMVRLFFIEQLYRTYSILANKKYHHE